MLTNSARRWPSSRNTADAYSRDVPGPVKGFDPQRDHDPAAVRAWASSTGVTLPGRGRIPKAIVERFYAAGY